MAVVIRLRRMGGPKKPFFRIVAADERLATDGRFLEVLGWYDPKKKSGEDFEMRVERVEAWLRRGARISDTVAKILKTARRRPAAATPAADAAAPAAGAAT
jgi:small subunit ribosomal protein S16